MKVIESRQATRWGRSGETHSDHCRGEAKRCVGSRRAVSGRTASSFPQWPVKLGCGQGAWNHGPAVSPFPRPLVDRLNPQPTAKIRQARKTNPAEAGFSVVSCNSVTEPAFCDAPPIPPSRGPPASAHNFAAPELPQWQVVQHRESHPLPLCHH